MDVYFKYQNNIVKSWGNISKEKYDKIKFVNEYISLTDSVINIKNKIYLHCDINPEFQYCWIESEENADFFQLQQEDGNDGKETIACCATKDAYAVANDARDLDGNGVTVYAAGQNKQAFYRRAAFIDRWSSTGWLFGKPL